MLGTLALTSCSSEPADDGKVHVVASINVWGNIAQSVGGDEVSVTSLIDDDTEDPHEYAASATDLVKIADADLIIVNGGGYDDFASQLLESANTEAIILTVSEIADTGIQNEHYWYDFTTVTAVATQLSDQFKQLAPGDDVHAQDRLNRFLQGVKDLTFRAWDIAEAHPGRSALLTEPLPYYLLAEAGFSDATPAGLTTAVESGSEIPVTALRDSLGLIQGGSLTLLARNAQTDSAQVDSLIAAAENAGVPVLEFRELLPADTNYFDWMSGYVSQLEALA